MSTQTKLVAAVVLIGTLGAVLQKPSKECQEWNDELDKIDDIRINLFDKYAIDCADRNMSLDERLAKGLPGHDPEKCSRTYKESIELQRNYQKLLSNQPKRCSRVSKNYR